MTQAANLLQAGKLPLGKGDVLNTSFGNNVSNGRGDPTYSELNEKLKPFGFQVSPENVKENRERILEALKSIAKDDGDPTWQRIAQESLDSNKAIKAFQDRGVEVVHAAGNDGADRLDLNFLTADHQLSSVDPKTQKPDKFSANNSLTESGNGVVEVRRQPDGSYKMGDVTLTAADLCALRQYNCTPHPEFKGALAINGWEGKEPTKAFLDKNFSEIGRTSPEIDSSEGHLVALSFGTSFANLDYLAQQWQRLQQKKHQLTFR
jgi:hypothetical protein